MDNIEIILGLGNINAITYIIKVFFISLCTYYTFLRIINTKNWMNKNLFFVFLFAIFISPISWFIKDKSDSLLSTICLILLLSVLFSIITKNKIGYCILITTSSLCINYIIFSIAVTIVFIPNFIFAIQSDNLNLLFMIFIHILLLYFLFKIRRFKDGFAFLQQNSKNEYFSILILHISVAVLFIISNDIDKLLVAKTLFVFIAFALIMFITLQSLLQLYYKHKLLVNELAETKAELGNKNQEITRLEKENLNFSKTSHSIAHRQKSLEYKLNQLLLKNEISSEIGIQHQIQDLSNEISCPTIPTELSKTEIPQIDDMFQFLQAECVKNKIDFELKISGNIYSMVNNFVSQSDLEILIADHVKNSIIAINSSENVNRSILVKLGWMDGYYRLQVYDSGIEFEIDTLSNLGQKPTTTHADTGGTGMGFMNTFDTLKKYQASFVIHEFGKPNKNQYTKSIGLTFDNSYQLEIISYRASEIKHNSILVKGEE